VDLDAENLILAVEVGLACAAAQVGLTLLFARSPSIWGEQAIFVAHQIVALPLMLYVTVIGCAAWFSARPEGTVESRIFGHDPAGAHLSVILLGALVLWDIPMTFHPSIYSAASMGHHVGLAVLAVLCLLPFLQFYAPFFVGVTEISSVPLQVVDFFRPEKFGPLLEGRPLLNQFNGLARGLFVLAFLIIRTVWFPIIVGARVVPDLLSVMRTSLATSSGEDGRAALAIVGIFFASAFTLLQWYWSSLLLKQVQKAICGGGRGSSQSGTASGKKAPEQHVREDPKQTGGDADYRLLL